MEAHALIARMTHRYFILLLWFNCLCHQWQFWISALDFSFSKAFTCV